MTITWVSTAYSIAEIIQITMAGWWTTLLGRKRLYLTLMIVFITGSILAGMSRTLLQMVAFRVLQGIGGGSLIPCSQAIVREKFPPAEQATAMALYSMGIILAPAIGPVVGGYIIDRLGWPWVFYINVPICIAGIMMVSSFVHDPPYLKRGFQKIDWGGLALLGIGITTLQVVLERGEKLDWFSSTWIVIGSIVAAAALISLVIWEIRAAEPVVNFRLFKNYPLAVGAAYVGIIGFALFGSTFILPNFTQGLLNYPATQAGLVMMPRSTVMFIMMPLTGYIYNLVDPRIQVTLALLVQCFAYWRLSRFSIAVGFWSFAPSTMLMGAGLANSNVVMSTMSLATVPRPQMTQAASLYSLCQRVGGNLAYAIMATLVARDTQIHRAELIQNISALNAQYPLVRAGLVSGLIRQGAPIAAARSGAVALINHMVNAQSMMMAFNDIYSLLYRMFLVAIPLVWVVPKQAFPRGRDKNTEAEAE